MEVPLSYSTPAAHGGDSIPEFLTRLHQEAPPTLRRPAHCVEEHVNLQEVTDDSERRDVTPVSDAEILIAREAHHRAVKMIKTSPDLVPYVPRTRGIVTVGGGRYTGTVLVSLRMLRRTNSTLPVEVFMPTPEDYDQHTCKVVLPSLNAKCVPLPQYEGIDIEKYQYKIFAVLLSSFEDVLFLDADNFPIVDPTEFIDSQPYRKTGYVLWSDFWWATCSPHYFSIINRPTPKLTEYGTTESGQMIISKSRHWDTLLLVLYYNIFGPSFYYLLFTQCDPGEGDKETWLYAALALVKPYHQVREKINVLGQWEKKKDSDESVYLGAGMTQHNPTDDWTLSRGEEKRPLFRLTDKAEAVFVHHNLIKLSPVEMAKWTDEMRENYYVRRMWGDREETLKVFGRDLESEVWDELLYVGCEFGEALVGWTESVCEKLKAYWGDVVSKERSKNST
ncbi:alpha-12-mannosyltransferase (Mnn2) protein [Rutstroemia sp. NJR-2017a BVV2]|nr:alpha-12-mannosyltransferase (Mnn2) protein [Rutstroemia sp. NJR-2017a BVV2]